MLGPALREPCRRAVATEERIYCSADANQPARPADSSVASLNLDKRTGRWKLSVTEADDEQVAKKTGWTSPALDKRHSFGRFQPGAVGSEELPTETRVEDPIPAKRPAVAETQLCLRSCVSALSWRRLLGWL